MMLGSFIKRELLCSLGGDCGIVFTFCWSVSCTSEADVSTYRSRGSSKCPFFRHQFLCAPNPRLTKFVQFFYYYRTLRPIALHLGTFSAHFRRPSFIVMYSLCIVRDGIWSCMVFSDTLVFSDRIHARPTQVLSIVSSISTRSQTVSNHLFFLFLMCLRNHTLINRARFILFSLM